MTEDGEDLKRPGGVEQSLLQARRQLEAVDSAIESLRSTGASIPSALTAERYELARRRASLEKALLEIDEADLKEGKGTVFVIMPFKEPFDEYYQSVIRPAVSDVGFRVARSDEIYRTGAFIQKIWSEILDSDAVIAEMTGSNSNVLYELGLCHAIDRKVIMITQDITNVPSDLRHINCVVYDTRKSNWADQLRNEIQRVLLFEQDRSHYTVLYPVASVDNTNLFERLESQVKNTNAQVREKSAEVATLQENLKSALDQCEQYKKALNGRLREDSRVTDSRIAFYEDSGITVATMVLPSTDGGPLEFVRIPEGTFIFGGGGNAEQMWLPAYWITRYSVTNAQYCAFLNAVGLRVEQGVPWIDLQASSTADKCRIVQDGPGFAVDDGYADYPVTYVNYYGALAFCEWAGGSLPSAEQWEKAARGTDGREYPWGSDPPNADVANIGPEGWSRDVPPVNVRAKKEGSSPFGVIQPIGNVWHWTSTFYPDRGVQAVRGGSFFDFRLGRREVYRFHVHPNGPDFSQGFLVCKRFLADDK